MDTEAHEQWPKDTQHKLNLMRNSQAQIHSDQLVLILVRQRLDRVRVAKHTQNESQKVTLGQPRGLLNGRVRAQQKV
jgi:hypothetical protein